MFNSNRCAGPKSVRLISTFFLPSSNARDFFGYLYGYCDVVGDGYKDVDESGSGIYTYRLRLFHEMTLHFILKMPLFRFKFAVLNAFN